MPKPEPGMPVLVPLGDGREHRLRFPLGVLKELKAQHGLDLLKGGIALGPAMNDPEKLAIILAAGLKATEPDITVEWIEQNVDAVFLREIATPLIYAATGQWIELPGEGAPPPKNALAETQSLPTGLDSGLSVDSTSVSVKPNSGA